MEHLGSYTEPSSTGLAYQVEYIFGGKDSDEDNLKAVASKLLFIREGVNFACLMAEPEILTQWLLPAPEPLIFSHYPPLNMQNSLLLG